MDFCFRIVLLEAGDLEKDKWASGDVCHGAFYGVSCLFRFSLRYWRL